MVQPKKRKTAKVRRNYWKEEEEILLKQWADKAQCYQWMHTRSREIYEKKNARYTIPVIIISTITGTANFAQERIPEDIRQYAVVGIGTLSIIAGIITTIYQFLKISEINEGHRVAALSWGKFHRNLESELRRHPLDRTSATELIKISKDEYDRLVEISPFIPKNVLNEFNKKFKKNTLLTKPPVGNTIIATDIFKMDEESRKSMINEVNETIISQNNLQLAKENKVNSQVAKFRKSFYALNNRFPTKEEVRKNMKYINDADYESDNSVDLEKGEINLEIGDDEYIEDNPLGDLEEEVSINEEEENEVVAENEVAEEENEVVEEEENEVAEEEDVVVEEEDVVVEEGENNEDGESSNSIESSV